jgi:3'(2'), 5'-bisphosphate nucleotidase
MYEKELDFAIKLSREAGCIVLDYYDKQYEIDLKKENEPVTQADKASNDFITDELRKAYPDDGILAEESKDDLSRLGKSRVWLVDPMDGTREFIDKIGEFAVMIGLVENGEPVMGVVYQPTENKLFYARKGSGAFLQRDGETVTLQVSSVSDISQMRLVVSRSHRSKLVDAMKESLGIEREVASGSVGLKVGLLTQEKTDLYLHPNSKTKEWDTCAPEMILHEAGGRITDCWGSPLAYNKENVYNDKGFVASNGRFHNEIVERIEVYLEHMD